MGILIKKALKLIKIVICDNVCRIYKCLSVFMRGFYCTLISILYDILNLEGKRFKPETHSDKDVVLIGNGPSANELDLSLLSKKYDIACVNWFATTAKENFFLIKPRYYFLIDPGFFNPKICCNERKREKFVANLIDLKNIFDLIDWDMEIIAPQGCVFHTDNERILTKNITTQELYGDCMKGFLYFLHKHNLATCGMLNVLCGALYYFIVNKFRTVYLGGADMSEFIGHSIDEHNHILLHSPHFYGMVTSDRNIDMGIPIGSFYNILEGYGKVLRQMHYLREFADRQGVKVINLSLQSFIDSFDKIHWEKILCQDKK